ncbi:tyrosine-protein phosphatase [Chloroflexota bacterium]
MDDSQSRLIEFESIFNFRDMGGYKAKDGQKVAWRRLFRSGELHHMSGSDASLFTDGIKIKSIIDLRDAKSGENLEIGEVKNLGVQHFSVPLIIISGGNKEYDDEEETRIFKGFTNCGEIYLYRLNTSGFGKQIVQILDIIADSDNFPVVFHCSAGKDRSGVIAAMVLGILGVGDRDIVEDYTQTGLHMEKMINRWKNEPVFTEVLSNLQPYQLEAVPESMETILSGINIEYGSIRQYLLANGAEEGLFDRL